MVVRRGILEEKCLVRRRSRFSGVPSVASLTSLVLSSLISGLACEPSNAKGRNEAQDNAPNVRVTFRAVDVDIASKQALRADDLSGIATSDLNAAVSRALREYPPEVLKANLRTVHLVSALSVGDSAMGGLAHRSEITVSVEPGSDQDDLARAIHHEIAHLLISRRGWGFQRVASCTPGGGYLQGGEEAIRLGRDDLRYDPELISLGFLCEYSRASPEEDMAVLWEWLMTQPAFLERLAGTSAPLACKLCELRRLIRWHDRAWVDRFATLWTASGCSDARAKRGRVEGGTGHR